MRRLALVLAAAALACSVSLAAAAADTAKPKPKPKAPVCAKLHETTLHWDAVFDHVTSLSEAYVIRAKIQHYGFHNVILEKDWCDDVEVAVQGLDTPQLRRSFFDEASSVGFKVSFEPPYTYRQPLRGYVTAVFGIRPTLARANDLQRALAAVGYREGTDILRVNAREWHVVLFRIPTRAKRKFAREARRAGFPVLSFDS